MTSDRPYRKALPAEMALQELINKSGSQFDPELVPHFIELLESGIFSFQKAYNPQDIKASSSSGEGIYPFA
jgi:HD-GYP domain-containing protein (c-di-GMP phosphodiesterase class II)